LGDEVGAGSLASRPYAATRDAEGSYYVVTPDAPNEPPLIFSATGDYLGRLGQAGDGPGEFRSPGAIAASDDTLFVVDQVSARLTAMLHKRVLWTAPAPRGVNSVAYLSNGNIVMNARVSDPGHVGFPLHLFDSRGNFRKSLGADTLVIDPRNVTRDVVWVQSAGNAGFVSIPFTHTYTIDVWSNTGMHLKSYHREPEWFKPFASPWAKSPRRPPMPVASGAWLDGSGRLWAIFRTAGEHWQDGLGHARRAEGGREYYPTTNAQALYRTRVDVIDASQGTLLTSQSMAGTWDFVIGPNLLGAVRESPSGAIVLEVWAITLSENGASR